MKPLLIRKILPAIACLLSVASAGAWEVPDETLHYSVRFRWGLIDANVGIATVSTRNLPGTDNFEATLSGKSVDLMGHYYEAGDAITGTIIAHPDASRSDAAIESKQGEFTIKTISENGDGSSKNGPVTAHLADGDVIRSRVSRYGSGLTIDMLSVFYYMRQIDYPEQTPGQTTSVALSDGSQIDDLRIVYLGEESVAPDGAEGPCSHIALTFTADGKSDSMEVWITCDDRRIPMFIKGSLSVGHMECRLIDQQTVDSLR